MLHTVSCVFVFCKYGKSFPPELEHGNVTLMVCHIPGLNEVNYQTHSDFTIYESIISQVSPKLTLWNFSIVQLHILTELSLKPRHRTRMTVLFAVYRCRDLLSLGQQIL
jgi:hypothetical protein